MQPKGMEDLATFSAREVKRAATEERERVFLCRRRVGVKAQGKLITVSFLKVEGRKMLIGAKDWRKSDR